MNIAAGNLSPVTAAPPKFAPKFERFVSAVEGRLVERFGVPDGYFGATKTKDGITWDLERVYPLTDEVCRRYITDIAQALSFGDLKKRTLADWEAWSKKHEAAEKKAASEAKKLADERAKAAAEQQSSEAES